MATATAKALTATIEFIMQDASGPNPDDLEFEVIDTAGDRLAYVQGVDHAADEIRDLVDPQGIFDIEVS